MQMTPGEILSSYKNAENRKNQVEILAQFNAVPKDTIIDILIEKGISEKELPKRKKPKADKPVDNTKPSILEHLGILITALQLYKKQNLAEFDAAVAKAETTAKQIDGALEFIEECMRG